MCSSETSDKPFESTFVPTQAKRNTALQDSHLASTLDCAIDPQSPVGFVHKAYTHHMAMRNDLISLVEHVPHHQEIHTLFTLLQCSDVHLHHALLRVGTQLSLGTTVSQVDTLLYDLRMENPTLPHTLHTVTPKTVPMFGSFVLHMKWCV